MKDEAIRSIGDAFDAHSRRLGGLETLPRFAIPPEVVFFDHFAGDGTINPHWGTLATGSATIELPDATPTVARLGTGTTASSIAALSWNVRYPLVGINRYAWLRWRSALTTAMDAVATASIRLITVAPDVIWIGYRGAFSTGFFSCRSTTGAGANVTETATAVPVDTAFHDFAILTTPDRAWFYIDGAFVAEHRTSAGQFVPTGPFQVQAIAQNGATAADRRLEVDWIAAHENAVA